MRNGPLGGGWSRSTFIDPGASQILANCCNFFNLAGGAAATDAHASSFLGGAQFGWMYQIGRLVVGGELDWSRTRLNGNGAGFFPGGVFEFANEAYSVSTKWTATATTTIGIARDRWMIYSKAGAAWAHNDYSLGIIDSCGGATCVFAPTTVSNTVVGWTVGSGVKWALTDNWFLDVHYDYIDFGSKAQNFSQVCVNGGFACNFNITAPSTFNPTFSQRISEVKVGLNYKFGSGFLLW
jgi:outer membrane immunogenic protein